MVRVARFLCILAPMLLTLASLMCTVLIMVGGTKQSNAWISNIYFFKIDTRNITTQETISVVSGTTLDDNLLKTGLKGGELLGLEDFYTAHLWNYCSGNITVDGDTETWTVLDCAKPKATFYFDVYEIFKLDSDASGKKGVNESDIPDSVMKVNKAIKIVSNVMVAMFCCGLVSLFVTFVIGWFGLLSRLGSCVTTIFADIAFFFILTGSIIATALYATLKEGFNKGLKDFGAVATVNNRTLSIMWIGVAFAFGASLFWMFSSCCCSARSREIMGHRDRSSGNYEKAPYTYERVQAPYAQTSQVHPTGAQAGVGYEPYRHAGAQ